MLFREVSHHQNQNENNAIVSPHYLSMDRCNINDDNDSSKIPPSQFLGTSNPISTDIGGFPTIEDITVPENTPPPLFRRSSSHQQEPVVKNCVNDNRRGHQERDTFQQGFNQYDISPPSLITHGTFVNQNAIPVSLTKTQPPYLKEQRDNHSDPHRQSKYLPSLSQRQLSVEKAIELDLNYFHRSEFSSLSSSKPIAEDKNLEIYDDKGQNLGQQSSEEELIKVRNQEGFTGLKDTSSDYYFPISHQHPNTISFHHVPEKSQNLDCFSNHNNSSNDNQQKQLQAVANNSEIRLWNGNNVSNEKLHSIYNGENATIRNKEVAKMIGTKTKVQEINFSPSGDSIEESLASTDTIMSVISTADHHSSSHPSIHKVISPSEIKDCDVLLARGGKGNHHQGSKHYRRLINEQRDFYQSLPDSERAKKKSISWNIVQHLKKTTGARFIHKKKGQYLIMTDQEARNKISQALREKNERVMLDMDTTTITSNKINSKITIDN